MLFFIKNTLIFILTLFMVGCGALKSTEHTRNYNEYQHIMSCGPDAINDAIFELNLRGYNIQSESRTEISRELRRKNKCSTITRDVMSLFVYDSKKITFPCEVKKYFTDRGVKIEIIKDMDQLKSGDVAVVLIHQRGTLNYHWITYPTSNNIMRFFGKDTVLKTIYLLKR